MRYLSLRPERVADLLKEIGEASNDLGDIYLEKAMIIYELCKLEDKTYSFERERKIEEIKQML